MEAGISDEDYMKIDDSNSNTGELERPDTPIVDDHLTRGEYTPSLLDGEQVEEQAIQWFRSLQRRCCLLDGEQVEEQAPSNGSDPGREDAECCTQIARYLNNAARV
ncbi:hypothetical protein JR316_0005480 [Psilocybe cubensis]|uniref:Uncharacterized protein n=1 Tax=Psilocybe cubensis TaxID=181762 RepID=A0ACB8H6M3_PSICU|nr:hypothetical protein JR316_0005480 [Psilocybe cubensis]KAH9483374.1 hypothetical protein JR316_0005480 [Psilocybe cubensis]